jgi:hypothetical protein
MIKHRVLENLLLQMFYNFQELLQNAQEQSFHFNRVSPTSIIFVDAVRQTLAPRTAFFPTYSFNYDTTEPIKHHLQ